MESTTRQRIIAQLRRGPCSVDELARDVDLTDNAVRLHLAALERDAIVERAGVRRGMGAGKPATLYRVRADAEAAFSLAYPPVLAALVEVLVERLPARQAQALLRHAGKRVAAAETPAVSAPLADRARVAADVLTALGAQVELERHGRTMRLRGSCCPLSVSVARTPETCQMVATLVEEVSGSRVHACCEHGERPRCCFDLT